jgi:hypothetical protein
MGLKLSNCPILSTNKNKCKKNKAHVYQVVAQFCNMKFAITISIYEEKPNFILKPYT